VKLPILVPTTLLFAALAGAQLYAGSPSQDAIAVRHPWARATPRGAKTGAVYMILMNNAAKADRLVSATTPLADKVRFHSTSEENGVSRMREMPSVAIPPEGKVTFSPGGMHIMVVGLKQPLREGETFSLTLTFEKAGKKDVTIPIAKVGAMHQGTMPAMMHGHDDMAK
jgi:copper(I)-binding protein